MSGLAARRFRRPSNLGDSSSLGRNKPLNIAAKPDRAAFPARLTYPASGTPPPDKVMDTARLRTLRTLPELHVLLRTFLTDRQLLPAESELITMEGELPEGLRSAITRAQNQGHAWSAWRHPASRPQMDG